MFGPTPPGGTVEARHLALAQLEHTVDQGHTAMGTGSHGNTSWRENRKLKLFI